MAEARPTLESPVVTHNVRFANPVLLSGATVLTGDGRRIESGYVLLQDGLVSWVGEQAPDSLPDDTEVLDVTGRFVTPGLIDTHSHLGVYPEPYVAAHADGNEATAPVTAELSAEHSLWPQDPGFQRALAGGVTALQVLPGSANLIGGRTVTIKLHRSNEAADMRFPGAPLGIKMACGENPKMVYRDRGGPATRMASIARMRAAFIDAAAYDDDWTRYVVAFDKWVEDGAKPEARPKAPKADLAKETLAAVVRGEILVHVHCYRADEMLTQIALADEFGYAVRSFHHAVEAYKIADVLAARGISVSTWADWWGFKVEAYDAIPETAGMLALAGGRPIIHSDSSRGIQRLNQEAAKALYRARDSGLQLSEDDALAWITSNAAWALGVDALTGSLEPGKMADVVVWSRNPFSVYATADLVFVDGVLEFDRHTATEPWSDFEAGIPLQLAPARELPLVPGAQP